MEGVIPVLPRSMEGSLAWKTMRRYRAVRLDAALLRRSQEVFRKLRTIVSVATIVQRNYGKPVIPKGRIELPETFGSLFRRNGLQSENNFSEKDSGPSRILGVPS